jgi:hypothetical protein
MFNSASELITLEHNVDYSPTPVSTDKRRSPGEPTSLSYWQIGATEQYGFTRGPIFKVEFVNLSAVTATHVKIWGLENRDDDAPIYPVAYLSSANAAKGKIEVYLKKFIFCNSAGVLAAPGGAYTVVGYKKKSMPISW